MFRTLRPLSVFSRQFSRYPRALPSHDGPVVVQRVRLKRPLITAKRMQSVVINLAIFGALYYLVLADDDEEDPPGQQEDSKGEDKWALAKGGQEVTKSEGEGEGEDEGVEEDKEELEIPDTIPEDAYFIPLGFARQRPQTYYKGSDPEWQSFIEFSKDRKRCISIRNELAGLVGHHTSGIINFQKLLGQPIKIHKYWLDIDFPDGPPPEYERSGLEIAPDYVAWTTRPVSPIQFSRLQTALWPTSMASSFWASYTTILSLQVARAKQFLGMKSEPEKSNTKAPAGFIDFQQLAKTTDKQESRSGAGVEKTSAPGSKTPEIVPTKPESGAASGDSARVLPPLPSIPQPGGDMSSALMAFKRTLAKTWHPPSAPPERGTFMVSGLVELSGSKAMCVLDVQAHYHPKESRWVVIGIGVRRLQQRKQSPKGGS